MNWFEAVSFAPSFNCNFTLQKIVPMRWQDLSLHHWVHHWHMYMCNLFTVNKSLNTFIQSYLITSTFFWHLFLGCYICYLYFRFSLTWCKSGRQLINWNVNNNRNCGWIINSFVWASVQTSKYYSVRTDRNGSGFISCGWIWISKNAHLIISP